MTRRIRSLTDTEEPPINLTPLIDVVFVILIMFIVVAPLLELDHVSLANAAPSSEEIAMADMENNPCCIYVRKDNTIWIDKQPIPLTKLTERLRILHSVHPNTKPMLFHDKEAHFGTYQEIKRCCEEAGFDQMHVLLAPAS